MIPKSITQAGAALGRAITPSATGTATSAGQSLRNVGVSNLAGNNLSKASETRSRLTNLLPQRGDVANQLAGAGREAAQGLTGTAKSMAGEAASGGMPGVEQMAVGATAKAMRFSIVGLGLRALDKTSVGSKVIGTATDIIQKPLNAVADSGVVSMASKAGGPVGMFADFTVKTFAQAVNNSAAGKP